MCSHNIIKRFGNSGKLLLVSAHAWPLLQHHSSDIINALLDDRLQNRTKGPYMCILVLTPPSHATQFCNVSLKTTSEAPPPPRPSLYLTRREGWTRCNKSASAFIVSDAPNNYSSSHSFGGKRWPGKMMDQLTPLFFSVLFIRCGSSSCRRWWIVSLNCYYTYNAPHKSDISSCQLFSPPSCLFRERDHFSLHGRQGMETTIFSEGGFFFSFLF